MAQLERRLLGLELEVGFADVILAVRFHVDAIFTQLHQVLAVQDMVQTPTLFIEADDELLGMATALCGRASDDSRCNTLPIPAVLLERLQEFAVFLLSPTTFIRDTFVGLVARR